MTETSLNAPMPTGPTVDAGPLSDAGRARMVELADQAGVRRIHMLGWRDLDDDEAGGSEVHASTVAALWAQAGLEITMRSSASVGRSAVGFRDGYRVVRRGSRYGVFPRAAAAEITGRHGPCDALVEIWNGMPFASPLWWRGPRCGCITCTAPCGTWRWATRWAGSVGCWRNASLPRSIGASRSSRCRSHRKQS